MEPTDRRREREVHHLLGPTSLQLTPYRPWEIQLARPTPDTHIKGWPLRRRHRRGIDNAIR